MKAASLLELKEVQALLECRVAAIAADKADENQIRRLKAAMQKMSDCREDYPAFLAADFKFHTILSEATENTIFSEIIKLILDKLADYYSSFQTSRLSQNFLTDSIRSFETLITAIEQKDSDTAVKWMEYHVNLVDKELKDILKS